MNYLILALTAYKATAEVIFDRFVNVTLVCQVFKPMLKSQKFKILNWSHQAIFNLLRSATNKFLMQTLGEYHELKSNMLDNEEYIVGNIKEDNPEKKENKIIEWFMFNEVSTSPFHPSNYLPECQQIYEGERDQDDTLYSLTNLDQSTPIGKKKRKDGSQKEKQIRLWILKHNNPLGVR